MELQSKTPRPVINVGPRTHKAQQLPIRGCLQQSVWRAGTATAPAPDMTPQAQSSSQPLVQGGLQQLAFRSGTRASGGMEPVQSLGWRAERHALGKNSSTRPLVVVYRSGRRLVFAGQPRLARAPAGRLAGTRRSGTALSDKRAPMRESSAHAHSSATTHASSTCANHSRTGNDICPAVTPAKSTSRVSPASRDLGFLLHAMLRQKAALRAQLGGQRHVLCDCVPQER
ncbi:hypothetical protein CYMTET_21165 [Cymbomonas tetramitiformis]|uniref:Uncharacterized protein n=1 Tax=Cymbomonas tetramitiformis TaxID=36881 RepID=A0AAE0L3I9_9CHLO|nr:hypothetical protein CYMTET_21165 [Cymbomonas tetramitiformis]